MVLSTKLLERQGTSTVLDYTISLVCDRNKAGAFSLTVVESSDLGEIRSAVAKGIRSPKAFVEAVLSITEWTELKIDFDVIVDEICVPLRKLDSGFAASIVDHVEADPSATPASTGKMRA